MGSGSGSASAFLVGVAGSAITPSLPPMLDEAVPPDWPAAGPPAVQLWAAGKGMIKRRRNRARPSERLNCNVERLGAAAKAERGAGGRSARGTQGAARARQLRGRCAFPLPVRSLHSVRFAPALDQSSVPSSRPAPVEIQYLIYHRSNLQIGQWRRRRAGLRCCWQICWKLHSAHVHRDYTTYL